MTGKTSQGPNPRIDLSNKQNYELLTTISLWNKYEIQFIENQKKVKRIKKDIPLQRQKNENLYINSTLSDLLPSFDIKDILINKISIILISVFTILLSLLVMKSMIIKLVTNWNE